MTRPRHPLGLALVLTALALNFVSVIFYVKQPDFFTAFTILPTWFWGTIGLMMSGVAYFGFRSPLSLFTSTLWFVSILVLSDEARGIARI